MRVFLSAVRPQFNKTENLVRHFALKQALRQFIRDVKHHAGAYRVSDGEGVWRGVGERALLFSCGKEDLSFVEYLAFCVYQQEAILVVDDCDAAYIHYANGQRVYEGVLDTSEDESSVNGLEAYSKFGNAYYYTVK